ncbi:bifunctional DNA primase/polymerase [Kitasatospora sp. NPDC101801]|uniref:bifunctional DNA primase/polymerase n=1 Tax=Kitasatospora sp. NPDC101801 TaxID=3364103 RepID=UPI00382849B4
METTEAAVDLAQRGLAVLALPPGGRRPEPGGWSARCSTHREQVRRWWREGDNIGVSCRASSLLGLDLDLDVEGATRDVLAALAADSRRPRRPAFRQPGGTRRAGGPGAVGGQCSC